MKLNKKASPNTAMDEADVVTLKRVFSALGYYQIDSDGGADVYPDTALFESIKSYQKDRGYPATGEIRKNDPLVDQIEQDLTVKGQTYVQRCQDDACKHCRSAAGKIHSTYTDVFEHPNCRCYLEPIENGNLREFSPETQVDDLVEAVWEVSKQKNDNTLSETERRQRIKSGTPMRLEVKENSSIPAKNAKYEIQTIGVRAIEKYDSIILEMSQKYNVDQDLIRATMYIENATGHKGGLNSLADAVGLSDSVMPMNINPNLWNNIDGKTFDFNNPRDNIEAATILLKRLEESIIDPTPEKIGTLWNGLARDNVNGVGTRIGLAYKQKPWNDIKVLREMDLQDRYGLSSPFYEHSQKIDVYWDELIKWLKK